MLLLMVSLLNLATCDFQFRGDRSLNLEQIVTSFHTMLQSPQFTKDSITLLYQFVMDGLFTHFFPDTSDSKAIYNKEDIEFFLTFANKQSESISLSKFKFHLDRILCKGWSKSGTIAKPLTFYKLEVTTMMCLLYNYT